MFRDRAKALSRRGYLTASAAFALTGYAGRALADTMPLPGRRPNLPPPNGPLRWLDSGDQKAVFWKKFFEAYSKARDIKVIYDGLPFTEIATVLPLGIRNGSAPDSFSLPREMQPAVAVAEKWVRPYDDLIPDFEAWKAGFPAGAFVKGVNVFDGKTYGLPFTTDRRCGSLLLFGKKAMELTEFAPSPDKPLTWDQFRTAAKQITQKSRGRTPGLIIEGSQVYRWAENTIFLAQRAGAACGTSAAGFGIALDYRTGEIVVDSPEFVGAVELLLAMRDDGSTFPGLLNMNAPQARALMAQGAAGMMLQGPWNVPIWERANPGFDFGVSYTPAPQGKNGKTITNTLPALYQMMFVNAAAKNPEYVGEVFRFLGTLEGQIAWANLDGVADPAIMPEAMERASLSARSRQVIHIQNDQVRLAPVPYARNAGFSAVAGVYRAPTPDLAQTVQGLFSGQLTNVKQSLTNLKDAMNKALDKAISEANLKGANVSRADLVFSDWDPTKDYVS